MVAFIVFLGVNAKNRKAKLQAEVQTRLIDKFSTAPDFVDFLNSDTGNDQDWVWKFSISGSSPVLQRRYTVGLGDAGSAAGVGNSVRMDFQTLAIFADGRVAVSFLDSTTHYPSPTTGLEQQRPALAIEQDTKY